ncbi:glycosyltransferase [bacterium]|nr:glycosyltransferase [bacterium]
MIRNEKEVIGFILKGYPRLSEVFIINEILLLEERGLSLHIFALRKPNESAVHDSVRKVRARVTYIPDYPLTFFFELAKANILFFRQRPGAYWRVLNLSLFHCLRQRSFAAFKRFVQAAYLAQKGLPGTNVSHLHAHFSHDPTTVAYFASLLTGLSYSFSGHAKDVYTQKPYFLRRKIADARFVVTCTEFNKRYLLGISNGSTPILRCYHGVDFRQLPHAEVSTPQEFFRILSIGRLVPKKGFAFLIDALHLLCRSGYDFHCTIIGNGPLSGNLKQKISGLGLEKHIKLLPPIPQEELWDHYRNADLFALACQIENDGDRDGIPNVIVEAMAMATPVVATRVSGIPECVDDGVTGILVAERNPQALADGIATLLDQPELACQMGYAGRARVEKYFDGGQNIKKISHQLSAMIAANGQVTAIPEDILP